MAKSKFSSFLNFFKATPAEAFWFFSPKKEPDTRLHEAIRKAKSNARAINMTESIRYGLNYKERFKEDLINLHKLIDSGADVNSQDENGKTPLMETLWLGELIFIECEEDKTEYLSAILEIVKILVNAGADVNIKDNIIGRTALHYVMEYKDVDVEDIIDFLLDAGADIDIQDMTGMTVLRKAMRRPKLSKRLSGIVQARKAKAKSAKLKKEADRLIAIHSVRERFEKERLREDVRTAIKEAEREFKSRGSIF